MLESEDSAELLALHTADALVHAGIDRVNSRGSDMSGLGAPMESVGEDREMKGSDWASAMRILSDMEQDQHRDRDPRDRWRPLPDAATPYELCRCNMQTL